MITGVNTTTFEKLQLGAGAFLKTEYSGSLEPSDIVSATRGGATITIAPTIRERVIDGLPMHTKEAVAIDGYVVTASFVVVEITEDTVKTALGSADIEGNKVTPRQQVYTMADFVDMYWIGELANGKKVQIKFSNAYNTNGLNFKVTDKGEGEVSLNIIAHYSVADLDAQPVEIEFLRNFCVTTFTLAPSDATLVVKNWNGQTVTPTSAGVYDLVVGKYSYTASKEGYITQSDVSLTITNADAFTGAKGVTVTIEEEEV